jgi:hypothetical protein
LVLSDPHHTTVALEPRMRRKALDIVSGVATSFAYKALTKPKLELV